MLVLTVQETSRINRSAMDSDFVVEVRSCCPSAHSDGADDLTLLDLFAYHDEDSAEVGVTGRDPVTMVDQNASAVTSIWLCFETTPSRGWNGR